MMSPQHMSTDTNTVGHVSTTGTQSGQNRVHRHEQDTDTETCSRTHTRTRTHVRGHKHGDVPRTRSRVRRQIQVQEQGRRFGHDTYPRTRTDFVTNE